MTLTYQGGPMSAAEVAAFKADPLHPFYIKFRQWEELAKHDVDDKPSLEHFERLALRVLRQQRDARVAAAADDDDVA
jgi:predicted HD phosphohydrolase